MWKISEFLSENFQFLEVKFSIYLNRRVFVMSLFVILCLLLTLCGIVLSPEHFLDIFTILFLFCSAFDTSGRLCFMTVASPR